MRPAKVAPNHDRRRLLMHLTAGALAGASACRREPHCPEGTRPGTNLGPATSSDEEYVWISAMTTLPLFVAHDHPALFQAGKELGVKVSIAGPSSLDIPGLVAAIDQVVARRPSGILLVGWDPSALAPSIDAAVGAGIPVICVDADVPASRRLAFVGTDWHDLGVRLGQAMVGALGGRKGKVGQLGLIEAENMQRAFAGFRSVVERAGLSPLEPQQDRASIAEATRVTGGLLQAHPDLVGVAGFDAESGPGIGQALKEAGKIGRIVATCVEAEPQHLVLVKEGALSACVGQKRALFTHLGVRLLHDIVHRRLTFSRNDRMAGVAPVPETCYTGVYTVTRANVDSFIEA